jgi:hypothetical protein
VAIATLEHPIGSAAEWKADLAEQRVLEVDAGRGLITNGCTPFDQLTVSDRERPVFAS